MPTAEVLARGKWSASGYRVGFNYRQGFTNVGDFPLTFGIGLADRAELFGSFKVVTRIDRDIRPLFATDPQVGGVVGTLSARQAGLERQPARRLPGRREVQPDVRSRPEAGGLRGARHAQAADRRQGRTAPAPASRRHRRLHRQQGSQPAGRGLRLRRLRVPRHRRRASASRTGSATASAPGSRRAAPAAHRRVQRREAVRRHGDAVARRLSAPTAASRRCSRRSGAFNAATVGLTWQDSRGASSSAPARPGRSRPRTARSYRTDERPVGRLRRLPVPHRLPPRRPQVRGAAAATAATAAATAAGAAESSADGAGPLRAVHGGSRARPPR